MAFPDKFPKINQELLSQLRGLFFSKDNPVMLPNNGFIGLHSIDTPATLPPFPYRYLYIKADGYGYILDYNGIEYRIMSLDSFGNLIIDNNLTISNNLIVLGASTFGDSIAVNGNINVTGEYQINGYNTQSLLTPFLDLPGKVGIWYAGNVQRSTGNIYDSTGQGRTLTYNGNPTIDYLSNGIAYADLDGAGDFWSRADETDLDILGTESWAANPGLTLGGFFSKDALGTESALIGKYLTTGDQRSYVLAFNNTNQLRIAISSGGTVATIVTQSSTETISSGTWYFCVGRFVPSTSLDVFLNNSKSSLTAGIPASIYNSNAGFGISGINNGTVNLLSGLFSIGFLCANALSDATINGLFHKTKSFYGVS